MQYITLLWLIWAAVLTGAQDASLTGSARSLDQVLDAMQWDVNRSGPILVINPQGAVAAPHSELPLGRLESVSDRQRALAAQFSRQIIKVGSVTVLVPQTMVILNSRPGIPDPYSGLLRSQKIQLLMGSLSPDQWRAVGSPQGLGVRDLSREQQPLFQSLLPNPFALDSFIMSDGHKVSQPANSLTLAPDQRADVRLRVNHVAEIGLPTGNGSVHYFSDLRYSALPEGTQFYTLALANVPPSPTAYGVVLRSETANHLKTGNLAFDAPALKVSVPLTGLKTVRDLMGRIAQVTHREFYADGRVARLPLWTQGTSALAGDLLQSLCLAVTGTMRRVGTAFVLTSDLEGIGTRLARLVDWAMDARAAQLAALEDAERAASLNMPQQYITFAPDDPLALGSAALQRLMAKGPDSGSANQYTVPLSSLPGEAAIRTFLAARQEPLAGDYAKVGLTYWISYVVPNVGVVNEAEEFAPRITVHDARPPVPPVSAEHVVLPSNFTTRALVVRPIDGKDAARLAVKARRKGLNQLWVEVPEGIAGKDLIKDALRAGNENGLAVMAVVRLMQTSSPHYPAETGTVDLRDKNLMDEPGSVHAARMRTSPGVRRFLDRRRQFEQVGDWLRPDAPETLTIVEQRLREVMITGLAGLALVDMAPPGYQDSGESVQPLTFATSNEFGYTPSMRLAFLRRAGYDPIDLSGREIFLSNIDLTLPFFPIEAPMSGSRQETDRPEQRGALTALQDWTAFRYMTAADLLRRLHTFIRKEYPNLPVLLRQAPIADGWWGSWTVPEQLPHVIQFTSEETAVGAAELSGRPLLLNIPYSGSSNLQSVPVSAHHFSRWVQQRLDKRKEGWDGVVLDLSALASDQAFEVLDGLADRGPTNQ